MRRALVPVPFLLAALAVPLAPPAAAVPTGPPLRLDHLLFQPSDLTSFAGRLWFVRGVGDDAVAGLWRTSADGREIERVSPDRAIVGLKVARSRLYFVHGRLGFPMTLSLPGLEPVVLAETQPVRGFTAGPGGLVYFGTLGDGQELWRTDGTAEGTDLLVDVNPEWIDPCLRPEISCTPEMVALGSLPDQLTGVGDLLYFRATDPSTLQEPGLWQSDGTVAGTRWQPLVPIRTEGIVPLGDRVVVRVDEVGSEVPLQIWSAAPDRNPFGISGLSSGRFGDLTAADDTAYWFHEHFERGEERDLLDLRSTDGETSERVATIPGATRLEDVGSVAAAGSRLFFTVTTPELGTELWVSDGTQAGTGPIDIVPGPEGSDPSELTAVGEDLIFAADDGARGREPWVSDGTAAGTRRLADLVPGISSSDPRAFTWVGSRVYFHTVDFSPPGRRLWSVPSGVSGTFPAGVPEDATAILAPEYPGFRFWVRITAGGQVQPARRELLCLPETVCVSGALPGRSELFLRIVGPRPNGFLWPTLVRLSTSRIEVWIEQVSTGVLQHYVLDAATPGSSDLDGLFDRRGFQAD